VAWPLPAGEVFVAGPGVQAVGAPPVRLCFPLCTCSFTCTAACASCRTCGCGGGG